MRRNCVFKCAKDIINEWTLEEKITPKDIMVDLLSMSLIASDPYLTAEQQNQLTLMVKEVQK